MCTKPLPPTKKENYFWSRHRVDHYKAEGHLILHGGERETLRKSCHFFEVAAVHISGLVTPVLCRQTGFHSTRIIFAANPKVKTEPLFKGKLS